MEIYKNGCIIVLEVEELGTITLKEIFSLFPQCICIFQKINQIDEISHLLLDKIVERSSTIKMYATISTIDSIEIDNQWQSAKWYVFYKINDYYDTDKLDVIADVIGSSNGEISNKDLNEIFNKTFIVEYCYQCRYFSNSIAITCAVNPETNLDDNKQCNDYENNLG
jgi:hypothetical protein